MLTMKDIIRDGHPTLRDRAKEVTMPPTEEEKDTLMSMLEFLKKSQDPEQSKKYQLRSGIGLAAPQINLSKRMIAIYLKDENDVEHSYTLFNPKIISHSLEMTYLPNGEGCLSVDEEINGYVPRYSRITVKAFDLEGKEVQLRLKGLLSICFQHEIDHLNGVMFYDRIDKKQPFKQIENSTPLTVQK